METNLTYSRLLGTRQIGIDRGISELFSKVWNRQPKECEDGLWLFGREEDGDYFDDEDALRWQNGRFEQSWFTDGLQRKSGLLPLTLVVL